MKPMHDFRFNLVWEIKFKLYLQQKGTSKFKIFKDFCTMVVPAIKSSISEFDSFLKLQNSYILLGSNIMKIVCNYQKTKSFLSAQQLI